MVQRTIEDEQESFDAALPSLLSEHEGEFALFRAGKPQGFFPSRDEAYTAGLAKFGLDETFLVAEVKPKRPEIASLSWELGVMFGQ